ncbi:MAG TPA: hypothetical protein VLY63_08860, partial [Anaerolineae bacterium]|nr:hypothetical protein [Anaerolineae bacterium]
SEEQERRVQRLLAENTSVSVHDHAAVMPEDLGQSPDCVAYWLVSYGYIDEEIAKGLRCSRKPGRSRGSFHITGLLPRIRHRQIVRRP